MKKIIVLGAKLGPDVVDIIHDINQAAGKRLYDCVGFLDDDKRLWGKNLFGTKVLGPIDSARKYSDSFFVSIIGGPASYLHKEKTLGAAKIPMERFVSLIHPASHVARTAKIGLDVIIFPGVVVWTNSQIGNHVFIACNSVIAEGCRIDDYASILLGVTVSGFVTIGKSCLLANGCVVKNRVTVGERAMLGLGSVVYNDVLPGVLAIGNPAKSVKNLIKNKR